MKKILAGVLAVTLTFSAFALPNDLFENSGSVISASAESWTAKTSLTANKTVSGDLEATNDIFLNGYTLTVNGDLYMKEGELNIGSGKLIVKGSLYIGKRSYSAYSFIHMTNSSASITVDGDFVYSVNSNMTNNYDHSGSASYTNGMITAGTISVKGGVYDYAASTNFNSLQMTGSSSLVFNGSSEQTYSGGQATVLNKVSVSGSQTINMSGYLYITQPLSTNMNIKCTSALNVMSLDINGKTVNVTGDIIQAYSYGMQLSGGKLNITGNFFAYSGLTQLGGGQMSVSGNYIMAKYSSYSQSYTDVTAGLEMKNANDVLTVGGKMVIRTKNSTKASTLSNGKLYVAGDFDCVSNKVTFSSPHTTILNGTGAKQKVTLSSGKFYNLELKRTNSNYDPSDLSGLCVNLIAITTPITGAKASAPDCTYNGSAQQPAVTVTLNGSTLKSGTDYTVSYSNNTAAGTGKFTVTGKGDYSGTVSGTFTIARKSISGVTLGTTSYTYDGKAKTPAVKDGSKTLVSGTDYSATYSDNVNPGTCTMTITGKGNYSGTAVKSFTISKQLTSLSSATVTASSCTYNGSAQQPTVTVKLNGNTIPSTGYNVSYSSNINAGTATVTITGKGDYTGSASGTFTINKKSISGVTLGTTSYTYDGKAKTPAVKDGSKALTSGTDYSATYSDNVNPGTCTMTITGKGNYTGSVAKTFTITKNTTSIANATVSASACTYNGSAQQPAVTVKLNGTAIPSSGYTVSYSNNTNAGTATITVTGKGDYSGTAKGTFTINKKSVSGVSLATTSYTYDGKAKTPAVKDGSKTLVSGTDYTAKYSDNVNVGTCTVTITGTGNYTGSKALTFTIKSNLKDISSASVTASACNYNGNAQQPAVTVTLGGTKLSASDYSVAYSNNVNAGTATVTVTGKGSYTGTAKGTFTINKRNVSNLSLAETTVAYDGTAKKPAVMDGAKKLTENTDYTATYSNNTNAGTASVAITGKGNYTGSVTLTFTIKKNVTSISSASVTASSCNYDGTAKTPAVTVTLGGKTLRNGTDYEVTGYSNNINAGTATVAVTGKGDYSGSASGTFTINKRNVSNLSLVETKFEFDGNPKKPAVKDGSKTLIENTDYTATYSNNTNAGTGSVSITGKGNYTGTATLTFTIEKTTPDTVDLSSCTVSEIADVTYDGTEKKPSFTVKDGSKTLTAGTDYSITGYSNNVKAGDASITIAGKGNYTGTRTVTFKILPKSISNMSFSVSPSTYEYDGTAKTPTPILNDGSKRLINNTDYTVVYSKNNEVGTATVTATGKGNYTGTITAQFTIKAAKVNVSDCKVTLSKTNYSYDGTAKNPDVTVTYGSTTLVKDTDYKVDISSNIEVGTAKVVITGCGEYTGTKTVNFVISKKSFEDLEFTITPDSFEYDGSAKKPNVTVKDGKKALTEKTDYEVKYSDNTIAGEGTVTITASDKGNYSGSVEKKFTIAKSDISTASITLDEYSFVADGTEKKPTVTVEKNGRVLVEDRDYFVEYTNNTEAGTANVSVTAGGNYTGKLGASFVISKPDAKSIEGFTVTYQPDSFEYSGIENKPRFTVKDESGNVLTEWTDYMVACPNNVNAGTVTARIVGMDAYKDTLTAEFVINPVSLEASEIILEADNYDYDGNAKTPALTVKYDEDTTLVYDVDYDIEYTDNKAAGTATATVKGKNNYCGELSATFTINCRSAENMTLTFENTEFELDGEAVVPKITVSDNGKTLKEGVDYKISYENNDIPGTATVIVTGIGSYSGEVKGSFIIKPMPEPEPEPDPDPEPEPEPDPDPQPTGVKGDVNGDGMVSVTDISKVAAHLKSIKSLTDEEFAVADVNGDGKVNVADLSAIAGHVKGIKTLQ